MRVNMKCNKNYNSNDNYTVSSGWINGRAINSIIKRYAYIKNGKVIIDVTEELVDFFNEEADDIKSAQSLARELKRSYNQNFASKLFKEDI